MSPYRVSARPIVHRDFKPANRVLVILELALMAAMLVLAVAYYAVVATSLFWERS
jgi:hypothetical protein